MLCGPHRDKTNKMAIWSESSLSAWRKLGSLATYWAHSEDSVQTGWIPRLICLRWVHMPFCWFCHDAAPVLDTGHNTASEVTSDQYSTRPVIAVDWTSYLPLLENTSSLFAEARWGSWRSGGAWSHWGHHLGGMHSNWLAGKLHCQSVQEQRRCFE